MFQVPGCLSTVHIHATEQDNKIFYVGDADAQMTKGLVAMLVNGLSGDADSQRAKMKIQFNFVYADIEVSATS